MSAMKRLLLVAVLFGVFAAPAQAAVPCWKKVVNDWYGDGKIASTYPLHCYHDASSRLRADERIYSSLGDSIQAALAAAVARRAGKHVPAQVGKGPRTSREVTGTPPVAAESRPAGPHDPVRPSTPTGTVSAARSAAARDDGGIPMPLLISGLVALALIATGAVGTALRRRGGS
jgi:hypothetical protein